MKSLGIYKPEFMQIIEIYSGLLEQYERLNGQFIRDGMNYEIITGVGGSKKAPIVATLEVLRKDILNYANQLGLTVRGLENISTEKPKKQSKLESALAELSSSKNNKKK
ncbi:MAG: P27 family phage terminase small subunit [Clostridia bacterium]|nr:P27 family phage terminase small subunit [Clostridia bacterium]